MEPFWVDMVMERNLMQRTTFWNDRIQPRSFSHLTHNVKEILKVHNGRNSHE